MMWSVRGLRGGFPESVMVPTRRVFDSVTCLLKFQTQALSGVGDRVASSGGPTEGCWFGMICTVTALSQISGVQVLPYISVHICKAGCLESQVTLSVLVWQDSPLACLPDWSPRPFNPSRWSGSSGEQHACAG